MGRFDPLSYKIRTTSGLLSELELRLDFGLHQTSPERLIDLGLGVLGVGVGVAHQIEVRPATERAGCFFIDLLADIHLLAKAMSARRVERNLLDAGGFAGLGPRLPGAATVSIAK